MKASAPAPPRLDDALTPLDYALPQRGPVPLLTGRIAELLCADPGDLVIDLCSGEGSVSAGDGAPAALSTGAIVRPLHERLARLLSASGTPTLQISAPALSRVRVQTERVLLRGGFASLHAHGGPVLSLLFERLDPTARLLAVDSAPSEDAPLFAEGLRRWKHRHCPAEVIARMVHRIGFVTHRAVVDCVRHVPVAECPAWVAERSWPLLATLSDAELERGLRELRHRYAAQSTVTFTSRFDLVVGTKLDRATRAQAGTLPGSWRL